MLLPLLYSTCWSISIPQQLQFTLQYQPLPPASSSPLVMRHILPIFHLIWTLEAELNPGRDCCLSSQKTPSHWQHMFLKKLQPFSSMLNLYCRSQLGLSAGWVMPHIWFFVSSHQHFIFWCSVFLFDMRACGVSVHDRFCPWSPWLDSSMQR